MADINEAYYESRLKGLSQDDTRAHLASREFKTIRILEELSGASVLFHGAHVCDLGCGDRFLEPELRKHGLDYIGFDVDELNLETDTFPLSDNSMDLILNLAVIEHLREPGNFLTESFRCLKPGGMLLVSTPNWTYSYKQFFNDYTHVKPYTPHSLTKLLHDHGFAPTLDFPNLRCQPKWAYTNRWKYALAAMRPFTGKAPEWVPSILKGKAMGIFAIGIKPKHP